MSSKSVHAFERYRSQLPTIPAPPAEDPAAQLLERARKKRLRASRLFAEALEDEAMADFLKGTKK